MVQLITTIYYQLLEREHTLRFSLYETRRTNMYMPWKCSKRNTLSKRINKKISWPKKPSSPTSITPSLLNSEPPSKTKRKYILFWSTVQEANCSDSSPSKTNSLKNSKLSSYHRTKFYAAQIVLALEALHERNVIYRE